MAWEEMRKKNALLFFFFEALAVSTFRAYSVKEDLAHAFIWKSKPVAYFYHRSLNVSLPHPKREMASICLILPLSSEKICITVAKRQLVPFNGHLFTLIDEQVHCLTD